MTEPSHTQRLAKDILGFAAAEIDGTPAFGKAQAFIDRNELGLALFLLMDMGEERAVSRDYWWHLRKAAEMLGERTLQLQCGRRIKAFDS